ncbi:hypothetical protein BGZ46_004040, partial [Entomortierella lignicola]
TKSTIFQHSEHAPSLKSNRFAVHMGSAANRSKNPTIIHAEYSPNSHHQLQLPRTG